MEAPSTPGAIALMPLFMAYPCCCCAMPGVICQRCSFCFCASCDHSCDRVCSTPPSELEDEPVAGTGASEDGSLDQSACYAQLRALIDDPGQWVRLEDSLWVRSQVMPEINICYVIDDGTAHRFGSSMGDWRKVCEKMSWHNAGFVLVNLAHRKAYLLEAGRPHSSTPIKQALRYLRKTPTSLGFILQGDDDDMIVTYLEAWWRPDESKPVSKSVVRDKLTMTTLRVHTRIEHWWP